MAKLVISRVGLDLNEDDIYGAFVKCGYNRADGKQGALMRAELMRFLRELPGGGAWIKVGLPKAGVETKFEHGKEVPLTEEELATRAKFAARRAELLKKINGGKEEEEEDEEQVASPDSIPKYVCRDLCKAGWKVVANAVIRGQRGPSARVHVLAGEEVGGYIGIIRSDGRVEVVERDRVAALHSVMELEGFTFEESWVQDEEGNHYKVLGYKQGTEGFDMQLDICCKGAVWTPEGKLEIK